MRKQIKLPSMPTSRVEQGQDNQRAKRTNPQTASTTRSVHFDFRETKHHLQLKTQTLFLQSHPEAQRCKFDNHAMMTERRW
ncbi:hypothetical protein K227x_14400 [Rubripirellula lacrimiformis]|uniref:Uncharacterized protein n=1 Tax=Rubripirellula lacrimiformis TaxID=1930273 RepID=A0A517N7F7_9BACT|nr:hypothetical protein [Rubripirellula lacrimiformis]QDT03061.1 hypothetical protein K227x_14400 [Rubripirellula lacrimiformis]